MYKGHHAFKCSISSVSLKTSNNRLNVVLQGFPLCYVWNSLNKESLCLFYKMESKEITITGRIMEINAFNNFSNLLKAPNLKVTFANSSFSLFGEI